MRAYSTQLIENDDIEAVVEVLKSSYLTQGVQVEAFESALCEYTGAKYAVTFNSATSALHASYSVAGFAVGDEVITSPISFVATSNMLLEVGATPIWCDVKLDGNIDERFIERVITPKTKAIVPIHFSGNPVALEKIHSIASKHNLLVIEDAAHALGSSIDDKKIGSFSDMTIFSFHAIKPITTGEGGAVLTDSEEFAQKLRLFRSHGVVKKQLWNSDMVTMGHNYRLTEIAAALGISQLKKLDSFIERREQIASYYDKQFKNTKLFNVVKPIAGTVSSRHLYPLVLSPALHCPKEDIFRDFQERGLGVQVHYKPIYQNSFYKEKFGDVSLFVANDFYRSEISIPCHHAMSMEDAKKVANIVLEVIEKYAYRGCSF